MGQQSIAWPPGGRVKSYDHAANSNYCRDPSLAQSQGENNMAVWSDDWVKQLPHVQFKRLKAHYNGSVKI